MNDRDQAKYIARKINETGKTFDDLFEVVEVAGEWTIRERVRVPVSGVARIADELMDRMHLAGLSVEDVRDQSGLTLEAVEGVLHGDPEATLRDLELVIVAIGADLADVVGAA